MVHILKIPSKLLLKNHFSLKYILALNFGGFVNEAFRYDFS